MFHSANDFAGLMHFISMYCSLSLLAIAAETLTQFLAKATGTAVDWVQMIGMKV